VEGYVAGQSVPVLYAGPVAAYPGLDQVNIAIPQSLAGAGDVLVYLVADGAASNVVSLNIGGNPDRPAAARERSP
jgi:uncharacterized protein (TIGR03437 family)